MKTMKYIEKALVHLVSENERLKEELKSSEEMKSSLHNWWQKAKEELETLKTKQNETD